MATTFTPTLHQLKDANNQSLADSTGFMPRTDLILSGTLSGSVVEVAFPNAVIPTNVSGEMFIRLYGGANGMLFATDIAGNGAAHTGITNMIVVPPNNIFFQRVNLNHRSIYVLQLGAAGSYQIAFCE
jgi:hypothetical protein